MVGLGLSLSVLGLPVLPLLPLLSVLPLLAAQGGVARDAILTLPASAAKEFYLKRQVRLINPDGSRENGPWDCYEIGPEKTPGFRPCPDISPDPQNQVF